jgi:hypothetical protein
MGKMNWRFRTQNFPIRIPSVAFLFWWREAGQRKCVSFDVSVDGIIYDAQWFLAEPVPLSLFPFLADLGNFDFDVHI